MKKIYLFAVLFMTIAPFFSCSKKEGHPERCREEENPKLEAKFDFTVADSNNIFENQQISFRNTSTGFETCVWEFGNSVKSRDTDASVSYPMHGFYTVKLTVFDKNGQSSSATKEFSILCNFSTGNGGQTH